ncbi:MAG TPA: uracil phosphoribosyltransferase [Acidimicrobiales bacterium]|nr:uracil phosphoribosyltransferase [Acidimicrobiales bacterium]
MKTTVVDHPLAAEQLTVLRDETTDRATFRRAVDNLAAMLIYEATRDLAVEKTQVRTPLGPAEGVRLPRLPVVVPVLRAGLGMADAAIRLLPEAEMSFVGLARDEETFEPQSYMAKLPARFEGRPVIILDPMLATGGSLEFTCRLVAERGAGRMTVVCVLAAPEGLKRMDATGFDLHIVTAAIDDHLNEHAYIVPGLGDAGDRLFGLG